MRAGLKHAPAATNGIHHRAALADAVGERLLAVHVLAGGAAGRRDQRVPMIRHGDDERVDVLSLQQAAIVAERRDALASGLGGLFHVRAVHIAHGRDRNRPGLLRKVEQIRPLPTDADAADDKPVIGPEHARSRRGRTCKPRHDKPACRRHLQKRSTTHPLAGHTLAP